MNKFPKFYLVTMHQSRAMDPLLHILKRVLQITKSLKHENIQTIYLYLKQEF